MSKHQVLNAIVVAAMMLNLLLVPVMAAPPDAPQLVEPTNGASDVLVPATLSVNVTDPEGDPLDVTFYGRPQQAGAGPDFTIVVIPDTQYYASSYPSIFYTQTQWVADNKTSDNIVYVASLGDNVNTAGSLTQWGVADTAYGILDTASVPYGLALGNHDGAPSSTMNFNTYFGSSRFTGKPYYGGHYDSDNDNHYDVFTASGMQFIVIFIEYDDGMISTDHPVLQWANELLQANSDRRAIVVSHNMLEISTYNSFSPQGQMIYNALRGNSNLFLMLGGHRSVAARRADVFNGATVYTLRSDYQYVDNQQSGYLRIMRFSPADDMIYVRTYSPTQNKDYDKSDADQSNFNLSYAMDGVGFQVIGTANGVASGGTASITWPGLSPGQQYEWYAITSDGTDQTSSATWNFTTASAANQPPVITEGAMVGVTMSEDGAPTAFNLNLHATDANAGDTLTWNIASAASNGVASASGTGTSMAIAYIPNANYNGTDSFGVEVSDGNGGTDTMTVNVTIQAVNDPPVCLTVTLATDEDTTGEATPTCADLDTGDSLTYSIVTQPSHGAASVAAGKLGYAPAANYNGADLFTYKANDGLADSDVATVSITVSPVNDAPVANADGPYTADLGNAVVLNGTGSYDPDAGYGDSIVAYEWDVNDDGNYELTGPAPTVAASQIDVLGLGSHSIRLRVTDTFGASGTAVTTLTIIPNEYTLTIKSDHGMVTKTPDQATYHLGDVVRLAATSAAGWTFTGWSGDVTGTANPIDVTISGSMNITANYSQNEYTLNVTSLHGTVTKTPNQATYHYGDVVQLTAVAGTGWTFTGWSGDLSGDINPTNITINGSKTVNAIFAQNVYVLTINKVGNGTVTPDVAAPYHYGDVVILTAVADPGWTFTGWSDLGCPSIGTCTVTMNADKTVTATFSQVKATGQTAPAGTTCQQFRDGAAPPMYPVQYSLKGRVINQVNPGTMLYYSKITLPAEPSFLIAVSQSNNTAWPKIPVQGSTNIALYNSACNVVKNVATLYTPATGITTFNGKVATAGTYYLSVKYDLRGRYNATTFNGLVGYAPSGEPAVTYVFQTKLNGDLIPSSGATLAVAPKK